MKHMKNHAAFDKNVWLFAAVIVPGLKNNPGAKDAFLSNFNQLISGLDDDPAAKIRLLVKVVAALSPLYNLKSFSSLNYSQREKYIRRLFDFPVSKLRGGLTGLRSLVLIAYYGMPEVWENISYDGPLITKNHEGN